VGTTADSERPARRVAFSISTITAIALVAVGTWLRLYRFDTIEFKRDEQEALDLALRLLADRPWSSASAWPTHGMLSSNGVANAPLFTWIVAAAWTVTHDPAGVTRLVALVNGLALYPLWRWACRRMDGRRALLVLAICAVSPFAVILSRKIWNVDLLPPALLTILWGIEWLRTGRVWRGIVLLMLGALLVGQLHQSGALAIPLLPAAIALQMRSDSLLRGSVRFGRPSRFTIIALGVAVAANLFFWLPYLSFLAHARSPLLANRPVLDAFSPALLMRVGAQIVPLDLFYFFAPDRADFLRDGARSTCFYVSVAFGVPLVLYGLWGWLRSPSALPVLGIWWWSVIALFTLGRIPSHAYYVLVLTPLVAALTAGAFDPVAPRLIARAFVVCRVLYSVALFALTTVTLAWVAERGGAAGDYGVAYATRKAQAETIVSLRSGRAAPDFSALGERRSTDASASLTCAPPPIEVDWLVRWLDQSAAGRGAAATICDGWVDEGGAAAYRWWIRD